MSNNSIAGEPDDQRLNDPNDDWEYDEDDVGEEPDYYLCYCCGYSTVEYHGGWGCPRCTAIMSPEYYSKLLNHE